MDSDIPLMIWQARASLQRGVDIRLPLVIWLVVEYHSIWINTFHAWIFESWALSRFLVLVKLFFLQFIFKPIYTYLSTSLIKPKKLLTFLSYVVLFIFFNFLRLICIIYALNWCQFKASCKKVKAKFIIYTLYFH
jgi:hypothetical protein